MTARPLTAFTIPELVALHDAAHAGHDGWLSIANQPRTTRALLEVLEDEMERADAISTQATDELLRRHPSTILEAGLWAGAILQHTGRGVDWQRAAQVVAEAAATKDDAPIAKGGVA
jgi:hypothetical protein